MSAKWIARTPPKRQVEGSNPSGPEPIEVYKDDPNWRKYGFNDLTGLKLIKQEGNFDAFVNMDNSYLKMELSLNKKIDPDIIKNQFHLPYVIQVIPST